MVELPKTEAELLAIINENVEKATNELTSKHNGEMASMRTKHAAELEKVKKEAGMSAEELAAKKAEEMAQANAQELNDLRAFKRETLIRDKVTSAGLPSYFVHDSRLLSAEEGDLDKVIKTVKGEYEATLPKGSSHSTVVQVGGQKPSNGNPQSEIFEKTGEAIGSLFK